MDKIARLRQEIERRKKICEGIFERESDTYYQGKAVAYGELLPFIDTLSEEHDESLEEAAKKHSNSYYLEEVLSEDDYNVLQELLYNTFIAGAKWETGHAKQLNDE